MNSQNKDYKIEVVIPDSSRAERIPFWTLMSCDGSNMVHEGCGNELTISLAWKAAYSLGGRVYYTSYLLKYNISNA
ncbi:hypothetical protein V6615_05180 [Oscillospiraceae bacterium PP1C4]